MAKYLALFTLAIGLVGAPNPAYSQIDPVMATVQQFVDGFNAGGNMKMSLAACAPQTSIVDDEFPPFHWQSCAAWAATNATFPKEFGYTNRSVTLGHADVDGDDHAQPPVAVVVAPVKLSFKGFQDAFFVDSGYWSFVLDKTSSGGWRIVAWTWTHIPGGAECIKGGCIFHGVIHYRKSSTPSPTPQK